MADQEKSVDNTWLPLLGVDSRQYMLVTGCDKLVVCHILSLEVLAPQYPRQ